MTSAPRTSVAWYVLPPFKNHSHLDKAAKKCITQLNDPSIPKSGSWKIFIHRLNAWDIQQAKKKKGIDGLYRQWFISILKPNTATTPDPIAISSACCTSDHTSVTADPRHSPVTPAMVLSALSLAIQKHNSRPAQLVLWPALHGAFRMASVAALLPQLRAACPAVPIITFLPVAHVALWDSLDADDAAGSVWVVVESDELGKDSEVVLF
eukprot:CAMPEP_0174903186 /NCGR_PEP_ID=MMETSP0167-20121228/42536_1 /TAXON_ID=38298 /ORGANISM="Rhodella maculata, Strain CCMP736" /LENGTH=208 /DNA_ID=CAMNT_0016145451 /DNA_START=41 /DNA_END=663 /DNA_ORIENTATION=+